MSKVTQAKGTHCMRAERKNFSRKQNMKHGCLKLKGAEPVVDREIGNIWFSRVRIGKTMVPNHGEK